jgi:large subunit ribosomal protein L4e
MKAHVLDSEGKIVRQIELPDFFTREIREDIILKVYLASLMKQPYAPYILAGMQHAASGKIKHVRHKWKTAYGYGISRVPRKIHTRRGSRFFWVAATIASARGGRQAHPPKIEAMLKSKKINKKEKLKAFLSALAATASNAAVKKRYSSMENLKLNLPIIFDSAILNMKINDFKKLIKKVLGDAASCAFREKNVRAGKGKARGRKYKKSRGLLIVAASDEKMKCKEFEIVNVKNLNMEQLAPGGIAGRLVVFTEKSVEELRNFGGKFK